MEETGGDLEDYVKINQDYNKLNDNDLLYEYYKQTKPHLDNEEIDLKVGTFIEAKITINNE